MLAHGFMGFETVKTPFGDYRYFGAVPDYLQRVHNFDRILTPKVPPTGSVRLRAERLLRAILAWEARKGERVVLVGHSMGGLDARCVERALLLPLPPHPPPLSGTASRGWPETRSCPTS